MRNLVLLPHILLSSPASTVLPGPSPLQTHLDALDAEFAGMRFAIVNLADKHRPVLGLNRSNGMGEQMGFAASMPKIAAMFAAFQLRQDLNAFALLSPLRKDPPPATLTELVNQFAKAHGVLESPVKPAAGVRTSKPRIDLAGRLVLIERKPVPVTHSDWNASKRNAVNSTVRHLHEALPNFANIFEISPIRVMGQVQVQFRSSVDPHVAVQGAHQNESRIRQLPFFDRMLMMINESDNLAAASCILDVGYLTICSALVQGGFYDWGGAGGLWLSASYKAPWAKTWRKSFVDFPADNGSQKFQASNALAAAQFMTLLAQERLVSPSASREMLALMDLSNARSAGSIIRNFFDSGAKVHAKIGIGPPPSPLSDISFAEETRGGKRVSYVIALIAISRRQLDRAARLVRALQQIIVDTTP